MSGVRCLALAATSHREALQIAVLAGADTRLLPRDRYLGLDCVHPLQIGKEDAATRAAEHDDAVARWVEFGIRARLAGTEDIDGAHERLEFGLAHGSETRVLKGGRPRVTRDLSSQIGLRRRQCADAAAQLTVLLQRHEARGTEPVQRMVWSRRDPLTTDEALHADASVVGDTWDRSRLPLRGAHGVPDRPGSALPKRATI